MNKIYRTLAVSACVRKKTRYFKTRTTLISQTASDILSLVMRDVRLIPVYGAMTVTIIASGLTSEIQLLREVRNNRLPSINTEVTSAISATCIDLYREIQCLFRPGFGTNAERPSRTHDFPDACH